MGRVPAPPRAGGAETGEGAETGGRGKVQSEKLPGKNRTIKLQPM
jgi:hypothetical protein